MQQQVKDQAELAIGSALWVGGSFTEPVTVPVNPKAGVYQMEKMKERWKELGKMAGEWGNVWAVKQKSENNAQREDCVCMIKCRVWNSKVK